MFLSARMNNRPIKVIIAFNLNFYIGKGIFILHQIFFSLQIIFSLVQLYYHS
jgi:hypothetical protein